MCVDGRLVGEMKQIESNFLARNEALSSEMTKAKEEATEYRRENEKLKHQILRLVELDDTKNQQIQEMERKMESFARKLDEEVEAEQRTPMPQVLKENDFSREIDGADARMGCVWF